MTLTDGRDSAVGKARPFLGTSEWIVPKERYLSPHFAELEAERLWPYVWQVACREEQLASVGDYFEYTIVDQSILIVRSAPDQLKAYYNSCLHRGTQLKDGCGHAAELRCRFHCWRWNLDGSIKEVTEACDFDPALIDPETLHLPECQVATWGGFVFINMDLDTPPLLEYLHPIPERLARFRFEKMRLTRSRGTVLPSNWKTALDAFLENYHTLGVHPQMMRQFDWTTWQYELNGIHGNFFAPAEAWERPDPRIGDYKPTRSEILTGMAEDFGDIEFLKSSDGEMIKQMIAMADTLPEEITVVKMVGMFRRQMAEAKQIDISAFEDYELIFAGAFTAFPNMLFSLNPWSPLVIVFRPNGLDPESSLFDIWNMEISGDDEHPAKVEREFYPDWREHDGWGRLISQDMTNIPHVQRGMHGRGFDVLRFGRQEQCIVNFHNALMHYVQQERLEG